MDIFIILTSVTCVILLAAVVITSYGVWKNNNTFIISGCVLTGISLVILIVNLILKIKDIDNDNMAMMQSFNNNRESNNLITGIENNLRETKEFTNDLNMTGRRIANNSIEYPTPGSHSNGYIGALNTGTSWTDTLRSGQPA